MNEIPDGANMIGQVLRTGQRLPHEPGTTLPQGVVEPFNMRGFASFFAHSFVAFGWQDTRIDLIEIGKTDRLLTIFRRKGIPQFFCRFLIAWPDSAANDQACICIQR
jgi:hypothetical protein